MVVFRPNHATQPHSWLNPWHIKHKRPFLDDSENRLPFLANDDAYGIPNRLLGFFNRTSLDYHRDQILVFWQFMKHPRFKE